MARRPGVGRRAVGAHLLGGVLDAVDEARHDTVRHGGTGQQTGPVAAAFDAGQLQAYRYGGAEVLRVVVDTRLEVCQQLRVLLGVLVVHAEHGLVALDSPSGNKQGNADERQVVHHLEGLHVGIGLRLEEVEVAETPLCLRRVVAHCPCKGVVVDLHQLRSHLRSNEFQRFRVDGVTGCRP